MDIARNIGRIDRTAWTLGHNGSVYVQGTFKDLTANDIRPGIFAYAPCWAAVDPGMTLEAHSHDTVEIYAFVAGEGRMRLDDEWFDVKAGVAVNIPSNAVHQVTNEASAVGPVVWLSIGLKA